MSLSPSLSLHSTCYIVKRTQVGFQSLGLSSPTCKMRMTAPIRKYCAKECASHGAGAHGRVESGSWADSKSARQFREASTGDWYPGCQLRGDSLLEPPAERVGHKTHILEPGRLVQGHMDNQAVYPGCPLSLLLKEI